MDLGTAMAKMLLETAIPMAEEEAVQADTDDEQGGNDDSVAMEAVPTMLRRVQRRTIPTSGKG